jgi:hypothetical protein
MGSGWAVPVRCVGQEISLRNTAPPLVEDRLESLPCIVLVIRIRTQMRNVKMVLAVSEMTTCAHREDVDIDD